MRDNGRKQHRLIVGTKEESIPASDAGEKKKEESAG